MNLLVKRLFLTGIILALFGCPSVFANHQIGSEIYYELVGDGAWENSKLYKFNFVIYAKCSDTGSTDLLMLINNSISPLEEDSRTLSVDSIRNFDYNFVTCNNRPPGICYNKLFYSDTISIREEMLPVDIASNNCCRDIILDNIMSPDTFGTIMNTKVTELGYANNNDSPAFIETSFLSFCVNESIDYNYNVFEPDGDQLIYKFCTPLGHDKTMGFTRNPPWPTIQYLLPTYATNYPLGQGGLEINSSTGQLTGTPQVVGSFAVGICVEEYRNGAFLGTIRQDIAINVVACTPLLTADLEAETTDSQNRAVYQLCNENTLTIQHLSEPPESITDFEWYIDYPDQPLTSNEEIPTFIFDQPGVFYGHLVINPDSICNDTAFFLVEVSDLDVDFLMTYDTCDVGPVAFTSAVEASAMIENYRWSFGDSSETAEVNPIHQYMEAEIYTVQLVVEDKYQCRDTLLQNLTWRPAPEVIVVSPGVAVGCTPLTTTIENRSQPVDTSYQLYWEFGDGSSDTGLAPAYTYRTPGNYSVYLSITSPFGCFIDTVFEDLIFADLPPQAGFSWTPSADPEKFTAFQFTNTSERSLGWNWIFDTLSLPDIRQEPAYSFPDTGYRDVTLIVEDQYGCFDTLTQRIDVVSPQTYFLPNAFTPNGDGLNDEFIGVGLTDYLADFRLDIFNRFGGLVFSSQDVQQGWDGDNATAGVYVYKVSFRVPRGELTEMRGEALVPHPVSKW